jgi:hypothetical protein
MSTVLEVYSLREKAVGSPLQQQDNSGRGMRMQERQARQLRQTWGDSGCVHPAFDKLLLGSIHDGYVCIRCGQEFNQQQRDLLLTSRKAEAAEVNTPSASG